MLEEAITCGVSVEVKQKKVEWGRGGNSGGDQSK